MHWSIHKRDCKSFLGNSSWQPDWVLEDRTPAFIADGPLQASFGGRKYLWGNVPALDVLQLGANEDAYGELLRILFAASGDLRSIITTVARLPIRYNHPVEMTINDRDLDVMARNVIELLIALVVEDIDKPSERIIHVWYSALVRKSDLDALQHHVGRQRPNFLPSNDAPSMVWQTFEIN